MLELLNRSLKQFFPSPIMCLLDRSSAVGKLVINGKIDV